METSPILNRFQQIMPSLSKKTQIQVIRDGNSLFLQTGEYTIQRSRLLIRLGSGVGILGGLVLAFFSFWGWAVSIVSLLLLLAAPRFIVSRRLLEIDTVEEQLILLQNTEADVRSLPLTHLYKLSCVYETKGWDPYNVVYAQMKDGSRTPILLIIGGSEKMAAEACKLLGNLLNCPAIYAGPFGEIQSVYTPALIK